MVFRWIVLVNSNSCTPIPVLPSICHSRGLLAGIQLFAFAVFSVFLLFSVSSVIQTLLLCCCFFGSRISDFGSSLLYCLFESAGFTVSEIQFKYSGKPLSMPIATTSGTS